MCNRIVVSATPNLHSGQYVGAPVTAEIGPLVLDKTVETKAQELLENDLCVMNAKIDMISFNYDHSTITLPCEAQIKLNAEDSKIEIFTKSSKTQTFERLSLCEIDSTYPFVEILRKTNTIFEINLNATDIIRIVAEGNITRDIIAVAIKMYCTQTSMKKQMDSQGFGDGEWKIMYFKNVAKQLAYT